MIFRSGILLNLRTDHRREMSRGQSQSKTRSGKRALERCKEKFKTENIVFIDVDSDNFDDVIIVDVPESSKQTLRSSRSSKEGKNSMPSSVISIDDDCISDQENPGNCVEGGGDIDSDAASRKGSHSPSSKLQDSVETDSSECQFIWWGKSPLKSKCTQPFSGKTQSRNRYGSNPLSGSSSSESESSDSELVEDSSGEIREQWQKAYLKKKIFEDVQNCQSGLEDQASASGSQTGTEYNADTETEANQYAEAPPFPSSCDGNNGKEKFSTFTETGDGVIGDTFLNTDGDGSSADSCPAFEQEGPLKCKSQSSEKPQYCCKNINIHDNGETFSEDPFLGETVRQGDTHFDHAQTRSTGEQTSEGIFSFSAEQYEQFNHMRACFQDKKENVSGSQSGHTMHFDCTKVNSSNQEDFSFKIQQLDETQINQDVPVSFGEDEEICYKNSFSGTQSPNESKFKRSGSEEEQKVVSRCLSPCNTQLCDEVQVNLGAACSEGKFGQVPGGEFFGNSQTLAETEVSYDRTSCLDKRSKPVSDGSFSFGEKLINNGSAHFKKVEATSKTQLESTGNLPSSPNEDGKPEFRNSLIGEREKLKETDEYKRAAEEEWASRQRQLQIQAEEAQRLRKRKKAEAMRLLDMERRQRQRVEEMREALKKGEETIKQKEQIRAEVRMELDKLEVRCNDMASLLRGLGIHIGGGFYPLSHEVHAAYKQALLRFHPDRASRTDIRQQVEAEEKFKLISRAKEKLLLTA